MNKKIFYGINLITTLVIIALAMGYFGEVFATMSPVTVYSEADITGIVTAKPDFSYKSSPKFLTVKIKDIQNYSVYKESDVSLKKGAILTVSIWGTLDIIKPECLEKQTYTTPGPCIETDPSKLYGAWNSYEVSIGDVIKFHTALRGGTYEVVSKAHWDTTDETIEKLPPQLEDKLLSIFLRIPPLRRNLYLGVFLVIIAILLLIIFWFTRRLKKSKASPKV